MYYGIQKYSICERPLEILDTVAHQNFTPARWTTSWSSTWQKLDKVLKLFKDMTFINLHSLYYSMILLLQTYTHYLLQTKVKASFSIV